MSPAAQDSLDLTKASPAGDHARSLLQGITLAKQGKLDEAADSFNALLAKNSKNSEALNNLAVVYRRQNKLLDALDALTQAIEIDPARVEFHYNTGNVQKQLGKLRAAAAAYARVLELDSSSINAYNNLGKVYEQLEEYGKARNMFRKALEIDPSCAKAQANLARVQEDGDNSVMADSPESAVKASAAEVLEEDDLFLGEVPPAGQDSLPAMQKAEEPAAETAKEPAEEEPGKETNPAGKRREKGAGEKTGREKIIALMNYLKALTEILPDKKKEKFMESGVRLSLEHLITKLEGKTGLRGEKNDG